MLSRSVIMWILALLLILLAAPLLGALRTGTSVASLAGIWIALVALFLAAVVVSIVRSAGRKRERDKAA